MIKMHHAGLKRDTEVKTEDQARVMAKSGWVVVEDKPAPAPARPAPSGD